MDTKRSSGNFDDSLPADQELDRLAVQHAEQEEESRMPETAEEMIAATLEPIHGCVDQIISSLSRVAIGNLSGLRDILLQINARIGAYLHVERTEKKQKILTPTIYARHVLSAASGATPADEIIAVSDIAAHLVAELNPLLHAAYSEYMVLTTTLTPDVKSKMVCLKQLKNFLYHLIAEELMVKKFFLFSAS